MWSHIQKLSEMYHDWVTTIINTAVCGEYVVAAGFSSKPNTQPKVSLWFSLLETNY